MEREAPTYELLFKDNQNDAEKQKSVSSVCREFK